MHRRTFVQHTAAALAGLSVAPTAGPSQEAEREIYELRVYHMRNGGAVNAFAPYLRDALIPALNRLGSQHVGVFTELHLPEPPRLYVVIPHASLDRYTATPGLLAADAAYTEAAGDFIKRPPDGWVYTRYDVSLLHAFAEHPVLATPPSEPRIFELRVYEGHNDDAVTRKVEMFDKGEIPVFHETGLHPVFFGRAVAGPDLPNLTYLLWFKDMAERDANWQAFLEHPDWIRMRDDPYYANTVSRIVRTFLTPTDYSQI